MPPVVVSLEVTVQRGGAAVLDGRHDLELLDGLADAVEDLAAVPAT